MPIVQGPAAFLCAACVPAAPATVAVTATVTATAPRAARAIVRFLSFMLCPPLGLAPSAASPRLAPALVSGTPLLQITICGEATTRDVACQWDTVESLPVQNS